MIDGSLSEIKTTVTTVESTSSATTNRVADLENRIEEAEDRISTVEVQPQFPWHQYSHYGENSKLQLKIDDLENSGQNKNLKNINLLEKTEDNTTLTNFLQTTLPTLIGLPADFSPLENHCGHRAPTPATSKPPRGVLVQFLLYSQREAVLRAALKKPNIRGSQLCFYADLFAEVLWNQSEFVIVGKKLTCLN